jgi:hypothetical protein
MSVHHKKLMSTVRVNQSNPALAALMLEQFGGPQGEKDLLMDIFALCDQSASKILDEVVDKYAHFRGHLPAAGPDDVKIAATGEV